MTTLTFGGLMRISNLLFILIVSSPIMAQTQINYKQEMKKMKRIHAQCMSSQKSSSNCHQDMMKACDASRDECLKMMGRMNMKEVINSQESTKPKQ
jgi:hypothetical protein